MQETTQLQFHIENSKPVALADLTSSLLNVSNQYRSFIRRNGLQTEAEIGDLYIREVKTGSIIVDLVSLAPSILPLLPEHLDQVVEFAKFLKDSLEFFLGKSKEPPIQYTLKDCNEFAAIVNPIANDHGSNMNVSVMNHGNINLHFGTNSLEANAIQNAITKYQENLRLPATNAYSKEVLYWHQAHFGKSASVRGDKAVIEKISQDAVRVVFANDDIKEAMTSSNPRFSKDWQDLAYIVDVEVGTVHGRARVYKITGFYPDETFDPNE
jgi:hypothetical protein